MNNKRGFTLINVLFLTMALIGLLTVSSGSWLYQMGLNGKGAAREGSRRLAEAAAQLMVARLIKDPSLNPATLPSLTLNLPSYPQGQGILALDSTAAATLGIPKSVNNLQGTGSQPGWSDTVVAAQTANLVAVGRYRGDECRVEVVLHVPAFPYVVASSVPVKAVDGLRVFAIDSPAALAAGFGGVADNQKRPGHVVTNAEDPRPGVPALQLLGTTTRIEGDAQSHGNVTIGTGAVVAGEIRPLADLAPLAAINVSTLDTATKPGLNTVSAASLNNAQLTGFNRRSGDLSVSGGLDLQGAVLYIDGSLTVTGGLKGKGAILATGGVKIDGGGALTGDNQAAIVAQGPVSIQGTAGQNSEYRGLIYTEGNLDCKYANIAGSVVVNNPDPSGSAALEQVTMIESPELATVNLTVTSTTPGATIPGSLPVPASSHRTAGSMDSWRFNANVLNLPRRGAEGPGDPTYPTQMEVAFRLPGQTYDAPPPGFPVTHRPTAAEPWYAIGIPDPMPADMLTYGTVFLSNTDPNAPVEDVGRLGEGYQAGSVETNNRQDAHAAILAALAGWPNTCANPEVSTTDWLNQVDTDTRAELPEWVRIWNYNAKLWAANPPGPGTTTGPTTTRSQWNLDLSQFFNLSERIRVLSWRQLEQ